ncbi:hypothetical protein ACWGJN_19355, partial [Streptomyces sp. NPDC054865]
PPTLSRPGLPTGGPTLRPGPAAPPAGAAAGAAPPPDGRTPDRPAWAGAVLPRAAERTAP